MAESALFEKTRLGKINDSKPARLTIKEFNDQRLFVTKVGGGTKPNFQLMYSLGDDIFLNTFSERLSMWEFSGLHIMSDCDGAEIPGEPPFLTFYKRYNIKTESVVNMSFAGVALRGYLVDMRIQDYNQNGVEGFQFHLKYLALLQNLVDADNAPAAAGTATGSGTGAAGSGLGLSGSQSNRLRGVYPSTTGAIRPGSGTIPTRILIDRIDSGTPLPLRPGARSVPRRLLQ